MKKLIPYALMLLYVVLHTILLLDLPIARQLTATFMLAIPLSLLANFAQEVGGWRVLKDIIIGNTECPQCHGTGISFKDDQPETCCKCNGTGLKRYREDN